MVQHIVKRDRGIPDRRLMHPRREWSIGLLLWVLIVAAGGTYATIVFHSYAGISVDDEVVVVDQLRYRRVDALAAIELYQKRQDAYDTLLSERPVRVTEPEPVDEFRQDISSTEGDTTNQGDQSLAPPTLSE